MVLDTLWDGTEEEDKNGFFVKIYQYLRACVYGNKTQQVDRRDAKKIIESY